MTRKNIEEEVQNKQIQLRIRRIEEAVEGWRRGQLSAFSAMLVIGRIVDPPTITENAFQWAKTVLQKLEGDTLDRTK